ncbi:MAG: rod shape-determining protein MreD [Pseudomonadota bacterium]
MQAKLLLVIIMSLLVAYLLSILPMPDWAVWLRPPWLLLFCFYWLLALPDRFSLALIWLLGLGLDALTGTYLGVNACSMLVSCYFLLRLHRHYSLYRLSQRLIVIFIALLINILSLFILTSLLYHTYLNGLIWFIIPISVVLWMFIVKILNRFSKNFVIYVQVVK